MLLADCFFIYCKASEVGKRFTDLWNLYITNLLVPLSCVLRQPCRVLLGEFSFIDYSKFYVHMYIQATTIARFLWFIYNFLHSGPNINTLLMFSLHFNLFLGNLSDCYLAHFRAAIEACGAKYSVIAGTLASVCLAKPIAALAAISSAFASKPC